MANEQLATGNFEIETVAFGIRFEPRWKIIDRLGNVLDHVLFAQGTMFGPETFPVQRVRGTTRTLVNDDDDTNNSFRFSERDLLLVFDVKPRTTGAVTNLAQHFQRFAVNEMLKAGMEQVVRYGFLIRLAACHHILLEPPSRHYLRDEESVSSMELRFTQRLPTHDSRLKRGVDDFCSLIYLVDQTEDAEVRFSIDYQQRFSPALDRRETEKKSFERFVEAGLRNYEGRFSQWLRKFRRSEAA